MFVGTWNMGGEFFDQPEEIVDFLGENPGDVVVLGFQEIIELSA